MNSYVTWHYDVMKQLCINRGLLTLSVHGQQATKPRDFSVDNEQLFPMRNPEKLIDQLKGITTILFRQQLFDLNEARQSTVQRVLQ